MFYDHQNGMMENSDEHSTQESTPLWLNRSLIVAFLLCLIAFLTALWLSNTLIYIPDQWSSTPLIQFLITYRVPVLLLLAASVLTCHLALRFLTREILGVPERFLDERQKIARDQAHRSAFKFVHVSFLLIPAVLVLKYLPSWLAPKIPLSVMKVDYSLVYSTNLKDRSSFQRQTWYPYRVVHPIISSPAINSSQVSMADPALIVMAVCLLLLCLFLTVSTLPMFVLGWKGKM